MTDEAVPVSLEQAARAAFDRWMEALRRDPMSYETSTKEAARAYQAARLRADELAKGPRTSG